MRDESDAQVETAKLQRHLALSNKEVRSCQHFAAGYCFGLVAQSAVQVQHIDFMMVTVYSLSIALHIRPQEAYPIL